MSEEGPTPVEGQALIYATADGTVRVEVLFGDETFWLTQKRIAELFGVDVRTVNEHLKNIFLSGELAEEAVVRKSRITAADGKAYLTNFYNLDAVIAVGYRVNSRAGHAVPHLGDADAARSSSSRASCSTTSASSRARASARTTSTNSSSASARSAPANAASTSRSPTSTSSAASTTTRTPSSRSTFFETVQNKLHWAITGKTAAEIVAERADADKPSHGAYHLEEGARTARS